MPEVNRFDPDEIPGSAYDEPVYVVSAGLLWELLGRPLSSYEKRKVADAIPESSVHGALDSIMAALGLNTNE
jgi:hypothetical protein